MIVLLYTKTSRKINNNFKSKFDALQLPLRIIYNRFLYNLVYSPLLRIKKNSLKILKYKCVSGTDKI